jgi:hypothetical protein
MLLLRPSLVPRLRVNPRHCNPLRNLAISLNNQHIHESAPLTHSGKHILGEQLNLALDPIRPLRGL